MSYVLLVLSYMSIQNADMFKHLRGTVCVSKISGPYTQQNVAHLTTSMEMRLNTKTTSLQLYINI